MFANQATKWYHGNQYNAEAACEHSGGVVRHAKWRITCDAAVRYEYAVVLDPEN